MIPTKDNEHYLYITPKGTIKDKKKADKIESIIFVQHISKDRVYEIVGIATELTRTNKERKDCKHKDDKNIEYGNDSINASLKDIFSENTYHGQLDITEAYTTFKAKNVRVPRTPITIIHFFQISPKAQMTATKQMDQTPKRKMSNQTSLRLKRKIKIRSK